MCWWNNTSKFFCNAKSFQHIAEKIRIECGGCIGRTINPALVDDAKMAHDAYTIDHHRRCEFVAIYSALLDPDHAPEEHPYSAEIARGISALIKQNAISRTTMTRLVGATDLYRGLEWHTREWHKRNTGKIQLSPKMRNQIRIFSAVMARAAQIYRETLERNRALWDAGDANYIGAAFAQEFNLSFSIDYVRYAVRELMNDRKPSEIYSEIHSDDEAEQDGDEDDCPALCYLSDWATHSVVRGI